MTIYFNTPVDPAQTQAAVVETFTSGGPYEGGLEVWRNGKSGFRELGDQPDKDIGELNRALSMPTLRLAYDVTGVSPDYRATITDAARTAAVLAAVSITIVRVHFETDNEERHIIWVLFDADFQMKRWQEEAENRDILV